MRNLEKYKGIIPAFYACYDDNGAISPERVRALTEHLLKKELKASMSAAPQANAFTRALLSVK